MNRIHHKYIAHKYMASLVDDQFELHDFDDLSTEYPIEIHATTIDKGHLPNIDDMLDTCLERKIEGFIMNDKEDMCPACDKPYFHEGETIFCKGCGEIKPEEIFT
jgi:hypothetical protein